MKKNIKYLIVTLTCLLLVASLVSVAACDQQKTVTITLNYNYDGAANRTVQVNADGTFDLGSVPTRKGYEFAGWYTDGACSDGNEFAASSVTADTVLYAKWTPLAEQYTVTYDFGGTTEQYAVDSGSSHTVLDCTATPPTGRAFNGYKDGQGNVYQAGDSFTVNGDVTLTAQWERVYTLTFDFNGGESDIETEVKVKRNGSYVLPEAPINGNVLFAYWEDEFGGRYNAGQTITVTENMTFTARWSEPHDLGFDLNGGSGDVPEVQQYSNGYVVTLPEAPSYEGFFFEGWQDGINLYPAGGQFTMPARDVTLTAKWSAAVYVRFHYNSYGVTDRDVTQAVRKGDLATEITQPERQDHYFEGWFADSQCTLSFDFATTHVNDNVDLYAKWSHIYLRFTPAEQDGTNGWTVSGPSFQEVRYDKVFTNTQLASVPETLTLPTTYEGKPVFGITPGVEAFRYLANDGSAEVIGASPLRKVVIPNTYTEIADEAFFWCKSIQTYEFEQPSHIKRIGEEAFYQNDSLTEITLPESITELQSRTFAFCHELRSLDLSYLEITDIPQVFTYECKKLTEVKFPSTLKKIHAKAFYQTPLLQHLNLPEGLEYIGAAAFGNYSGSEEFALTGELWENYTSTRRPDGSFYEDYTGCHSELLDIVIPSTVQFIGDFAFAWHAKASKIEFVDGCPQLTHIGAYAFAFCKSVQSIELPANLKYLGYEIASVTETTLEFVANPGSYYDYDVMQLYGSVFESCESLTEIVLPEIVDYLPPRMFRNCKALQNVTFLNKDIQFFAAWRAFAGCTSLTAFTIPASVKLVADEAFAGCTQLQEVIFEQGSQCETIFNGVFKDCEKLTTIQLPATLHDIGGEAFKGCTSLQSVTLPDSLVNIGISGGTPLGEVFADTAITELHLGKNISNIAPYAFANMHKLERLDIAPESGMTSFRDFHDTTVNANVSYTFLNDENLQKLTINDNFGGFSLTSGIGALFGVGAFEGCVKFSEFAVSPTHKSMVAEDGVLYSRFDTVNSTLMAYPVGKSDDAYTVLSTIGDKDVSQIYYNAFRGNYHLKKLILPATVGQILNGAFREAQSLEEVEFAENSNLDKIGSLAFYMISTYPKTNGVYDVNVQPTKTPLRSVTLRCSTVPEMTLSNATLNGESISLTPFAYSTENAAFAIYVPDALVEQFKQADGWSTLAKFIKPLSEKAD